MARRRAITDAINDLVRGLRHAPDHRVNPPFNCLFTRLPGALDGHDCVRTDEATHHECDLSVMEKMRRLDLSAA